jgi:hypothetical protein
MSPARGPGLSPMGFSLPTNLTGQGLGRDPAAQKKKILGPNPARNIVLCYFTLWNARSARPSSGPARAQPKKLGPTCPVGRSWAGLFQPEITRLFSAWPEPGLAHKMLRSIYDFGFGHFSIRGRLKNLNFKCEKFKRNFSWIDDLKQKGC